MGFQNLQHELVEENPSLCEEIRIEFAHLIDGNHAREKTKNPLRCIHLCFYIILPEVVIDIGQVYRNESFDDLTMFIEPRHFRSENISQQAVFDQCHKQPKSHRLTTVNQQRTTNKVHSLHIVNLPLIIRECLKYSPQFNNPLLISLVERMSGESSAQVPLDLGF